MAVSKKILIVDDEREIRLPLREFLEAESYEVTEASTAKGAEQAFAKETPDAVLLDYNLPDANALDLIPKLKSIDDSVPLIMVTGNGSIELAVQAMREGAEHFLTKPVQLSALGVILKRALENSKNRRLNLAARSRESRDSFDPFLGTSEAIRKLREDALLAAEADRPVLIYGETGVGKGVLAKWIHKQGPRADEAFVDLNCAGLSREFLETELFGHEKGAFTGAASMKFGLLEVGHGGTVFLDEIGDVDIHVQPKLLKVLEEKQFRRLGSVRDQRVDIRLVAATHQPLSELIGQNKFRQDLYFRISTLQLRIPPLRERSADIAELSSTLIQRFASELRREVLVPPETLALLQSYPWPGNIRELRNVLERTVLLSQRREIMPGDLRFDALPAQHSTKGDGRGTLEERERDYIQDVLQNCGGNVAAAIKILGISKSALYRKIKEFSIRSQPQ